MATAAATPSARGVGAAAPATPWIAGIVLAFANFMVVLDMSIANVSIPHIAGSLAISPDQGTWVITSYSVAEAICVPLTGWLASRFGTVRTYLLAMTGFGLFSVACGLSVSLGMLVACRVGQGLCGGPIMPLTQTLLLRIFPPAKRSQAMAIWSMTTVTAPIVGPLLGGALSDQLSWHWIFFINVPVALACVFGASALLKGKETDTVRQPIDVIGLVLLVIWVGSLQIMLDLGRDRDWFHSTFIVALAAIAGVVFVVFVIWELTAAHPAVDLKVFRHRGFAVATASMALTFGTFFAGVVVTPQWLQLSLGYTATYSGYVIAWQGLSAVTFSPIVGRYVGLFDPRLVVTVGISVMAGSMWMRTQWVPEPDYWTLVIPHLMLGAGMAAFFVPMTMISLSSVEPRETASAAGLFAFNRTIAVAFGTSIANTFYLNGTERSRAALVDTLGPTADLQAKAAAMGLSSEQTRGLLARMVESQGAALSLLHLFQTGAAILIGCACLIWLSPRPRLAGAPPPGAH